jgi:diguanylate cyclase (GGDEF)-like protein
MNMRVTEKLVLHKSKSLAQAIIFSIFALLLVSTGILALFNFIELKEKLVEMNVEQTGSLVLAYSEILDGDSIELDFQRREKNVYYSKWSAISDSVLKKTGIKYLYVMNISYNDSIEYYISAKDHLGKINFLEKEKIDNFDTTIINKLKSKLETKISQIDYYSNYGWLIYSYVPIKNSNGKVVAFVGADKEMLNINKDMKEIGVKLLLANILFIVIVFLLIIYLLRKIFISPIIKIIDAADNFNLLNVSFKHLDLTHIEEYDTLIESFRKMERKINYAIKKSFTDELTKLNNRYFFTLSLENILKPVQHEKKIAFFVIDLDYFKQINDTYGHEKGDFVLKNTGIILKQAFEGLPGVVVRLGGDEFAVCLDDIADRKIVEDKCKLLKEELSQITYAQDKTGVSASIGVIIIKFSTVAPIYAEIFSAADVNLYKVKAKGKNGYLISEI